VLSVVTLLVVAAVAGWQSTEEIPLWAAALLQVPMWAGLLGAVLWAGSKGGGVVQDFGVRMRWFDPFLGVAVGAFTQLLVLPLLYVPLLELLDVSRDELARPARELSERAEGTWGWVVLSLMVVVGAPLVEELFYRGLLLRSLEKRRWPAVASVAGSAALFALLHFQPLQFAGLFVFGLVLAALSVGFGRLGPAVWAHVAFNASTVVVLYLETT
jgi:membrane protease YdiL (CAAX protease family)